MTIRPNEEERNFGADRERQREVADESGRLARSTGTEDGAAEGSTSRPRSNRGFASMDRSKQREIASKGGRAAHEKGTAHEFDSGEARAAGRKGGVTVSRNREHMAAIGRRGGEARGANRAARLQSQDSPERAKANPVPNADTRGQSQDTGLGASQGNPRSSGSITGESRANQSAERNVERP